MKKLLLVLIFLVGLINFASASDCGGNVQCNCGDILVSNLVMKQDILNCPSKAISIFKDGVILDCSDHEIDGKWYPGANQYGIYLEASAVLIKNCNIGDFFGDGNAGVYLSGNGNSLIDNNIYESFVGIYLSGNENVASDNNIHHNDLEGLKLFNASRNSIFSNYIHSNDYGIGVFGNSFGNKIYNNQIEFHILNGVFITSSHNSFFKNKFMFNSGEHVYEDSIYGNSWDFNGIGNYWDDFRDNIGYPLVYVLPFPSRGIDHFPMGWQSLVPL